MAANSVGPAWAEVRAALLTHTWRTHNSDSLHHRKVLGNYFNAHQISVGGVQRAWLVVNVITWVMVTVLMDVISLGCWYPACRIAVLLDAICLKAVYVHKK